MRKQIRKLYTDVEAYVIPRSEEQAIRKSMGSPTYGEMTPTSVQRLLDHLDLGDRDVFYDLGSGTGKIVIQTAMTVPIRKAVGIELSTSRHRDAKRVLGKVRKEGLLAARACSFRNEDLASSYLSDATVVYSCSTAFSLRFMKVIARKLESLNRDLTFVSLQELDPPRNRFELTHTLRLDMTWHRRTAVYVYRVHAKRRPRQLAR
jgi:SAM-dependent methyltransferase